MITWETLFGMLTSGALFWMLGEAMGRFYGWEKGWRDGMEAQRKRFVDAARYDIAFTTHDGRRTRYVTDDGGKWVDVSEPAQ